MTDSVVLLVCLIAIIIEAIILEIQNSKCLVNFMKNLHSEPIFDSFNEKRSCSISNGRLRRNNDAHTVASYNIRNIDVSEVQNIQNAPSIEENENSPETTRYKPTNSSQRSIASSNFPNYDLSEIELPAY